MKKALGDSFAQALFFYSNEQIELTAIVRPMAYAQSDQTNALVQRLQRTEQLDRNRRHGGRLVPRINSVTTRSSAASMSRRSVRSCAKVVSQPTDLRQSLAIFAKNLL